MRETKKHAGFRPASLRRLKCSMPPCPVQSNPRDPIHPLLSCRAFCAPVQSPVVWLLYGGSRDMNLVGDKVKVGVESGAAFVVPSAVIWIGEAKKI
jgi:hypothetical protein